MGAAAHSSCTPVLAGTRAAAPPGPPIYVDLAYLPGSWSARTVDEEFFRRIRSLCYVVSGDDHLKEGVLRSLLDALLAGKHQWGTDIQVRPPAFAPRIPRAVGSAPSRCLGGVGVWVVVMRCGGCLCR